MEKWIKEVEESEQCKRSWRVPGRREQEAGCQHVWHMM